MRTALLILFGTMLAAFGLTWLVRRALVRRRILDHPNERSSHRVPTPHGGGLAVIPVLLVAMVAIALITPIGLDPLWRVIVAAAALALISWLDDLRSVNAAARLAVQFAAVAAGLSLIPADQMILQGALPFWADRLVAGLAWVWFINLYNFMDGIDGITGAETIAIGLGLFLIAGIGPHVGPNGLIGLAAAGAAAGFLFWNWHPARIFLGDVGAVPLGFLVGWLLVSAAAAGAWAAALILPGYYLADATITLIPRLMRREPVWQGHRGHFYQRAVKRGLSHAQVVRRISLGNLLLVLCAIVSEGEPRWRLPALAVAALVVLVLLALLAGGRRAATKRAGS